VKAGLASASVRRKITGLVLSAIRFRGATRIALLGEQIAIRKSAAGRCRTIRYLLALAGFADISQSTRLIATAAVKRIVVRIDTATAVQPSDFTTNRDIAAASAAGVGARDADDPTAAISGSSATPAGNSIARTVAIEPTGVSRLAGVVRVALAARDGLRTTLSVAIAVAPSAARANQTGDDGDAAKPDNRSQVPRLHRLSP
jgi:hypothetical protein